MQKIIVELETCALKLEVKSVQNPPLSCLNIFDYQAKKCVFVKCKSLMNEQSIISIIHLQLWSPF